MSRGHELIFKNDNLTLTNHPTKGYWLYDRTRGMNLAMRAETEREAFVEALAYYHRRLPAVEAAHKELCKKVEVFVGQFIEDADDADANAL